jgi:hypothetical protein
MHAVAAVGLLVVVSGLSMIARPGLWGRGIAAYAGCAHFHRLEAGSRPRLGGVLIACADEVMHLASSRAWVS